MKRSLQLGSSDRSNASSNVLPNSSRTTTSPARQDWLAMDGAKNCAPQQAIVKKMNGQLSVLFPHRIISRFI